MKKSDKPITNPLVVLREEFDDWAVLFNPETADAVGINPVGVVIWKLMDGQRCVEELVKEIENHFADVPDTASEDVTAFVNDLAERGFVGYELNEI